MSLDQGTSSTRAGLIDISGQIVASIQVPFNQTFPREGWVEQDPWDIFNSAIKAMELLLDDNEVSVSEIHSIGVTNQRETTIVWETISGKPIYNAIGWQCRRTAGQCQSLVTQGDQSRIREITGLPIDPEFSATKISWILDQIPGARQRAARGDIKFGTVDSWLIWNLSNKSIHVTDVTNASRTMLFDMKKLEWSTELLDLFNIPEAMLPEIVPSNTDVGEITGSYLGGQRKKITGVIGDQQSALFGQTCFLKGMTKCTYGTGAFVLLNTGPELVGGEDGLIRTIAWMLDDQVTYALEGVIFSAGATVNWALNVLGIYKDASELEILAGAVSHSNGVILVPAFAGLGTPHWDSTARGTIQGLSLGTTKEHLARAILESTTFQCSEILDSFYKHSDISISILRVDGGGSANDIMMQHQADLLGIKVQRSANSESTMLGAAYLAGLKIGFWKNLKQVEKLWKAEVEFRPDMPFKKRTMLKNQWRRAVLRSKNWTKLND